VVIQSPSPQITAVESIFPSVTYNKPILDVTPISNASTFSSFLQIAQVFPQGQSNPNLNVTIVNPSGDGLAPHSIDNLLLNPTNTAYKVTYTGGFVTGFNLPINPSTPLYFAANEYYLTAYQAANPSYNAIFNTPAGPGPNSAPNIPVNYSMATPFVGSVSSPPAQLYEEANYRGIVSWGRWANGFVQQMGGYHNGNPILLSADQGFHFIIGSATDPTIAANSSPGTVNFNLYASTTPTAVTGGQLWATTGGTLSTNFRTGAIAGNLSLFTNQASGYGNFNMAFSGSTGNTTNPLISAVNGTVSKINGTLAICGGGCAATGNVSYYGNINSASSNPGAAGLAYSFNTGSNVVQGVAVYKK